MKQAELLDKDQSLVMRTMRSYQQINDYNCGLYAIKNAWAVINCQDWSEVMKNAPQIDAFNHLYDTVMQN